MSELTYRVIVMNYTIEMIESIIKIILYVKTDEDGVSETELNLINEKL